MRHDFGPGEVVVEGRDRRNRLVTRFGRMLRKPERISRRDRADMSDQRQAAGRGGGNVGEVVRALVERLQHRFARAAADIDPVDAETDLKIDERPDGLPVNASSSENGVRRAE